MEALARSRAGWRGPFLWPPGAAAAGCAEPSSSANAAAGRGAARSPMFAAVVEQPLFGELAPRQDLAPHEQLALALRPRTSEIAAALPAPGRETLTGRPSSRR